MYAVRRRVVQREVKCHKLHGVPCRLDHEHWAEYRRSTVHPMYARIVQCGVKCVSLYGVRSWLDHEHWAECRSDRMYAVHGGAIQCGVECHKLHGVRCWLDHEHWAECRSVGVHPGAAAQLRNWLLLYTYAASAVAYSS